MRQDGALLVIGTSFKLVMPDGTPSLLDKASGSGWAQNCGIKGRAPQRPSPTSLYTNLLCESRVNVRLFSREDVVS